MNDPHSPALSPPGDPAPDATHEPRSDADEARVGPDIDFTDPNSPLAKYYFQASHVLATMLIVAIFLFFNLMTPLWHSDVWGHLKIGEWIALNRQWPERELFSPSSDPTLVPSNFQWVSQLILHGAFRTGAWLAGGSPLKQIAGGIDFLRALHALCEAAKGLLLLLAFRRFIGSLPWACAGVVLVFIFSLAPAAIQRPQVFAEVLFAAVLWLMARRVLPTPLSSGTPGERSGGEGAEPAESVAPLPAATNPLPTLSPGVPGEREPSTTAYEQTDDARLSWRQAFLLAALLVLWTNLHGSFMIGIALVGALWLGQTIESFLSRGLGATLRDAPLHRPLIAVVLGTVLLSLLNPHGLRAIPDVLSFAKNPNILTMQEWRPLDFSAGGGGHWGYLILFGLIVATQVVSPRLYTPTQLLLLAVFGVAPVLQERMMTWWVMLVPVLVLPIWAEILTLPADLRERCTSILSLRKTILAAAIVAVGVVWSSPVQLLLGHPPVPIGLSSSRATLWPITQDLLDGNAPESMADAQALQNDPLATALAAGLQNYPDKKFHGRIFTLESMGDYLVWSLPPKAPVMVYSHVHVFPPDYWDDYMEVLVARPGWRTVLDRERVNLLICQIEQRQDLLDALKADPDWDVILDQSDEPLHRSYRLFAALRKKPLGLPR
jgi:hypothetical protein